MKKRLSAPLMLLLLLLLAASASAQGTEGYTSYQGRVLSVQVLEPEPFEEEGWENQLVTVEILSGPHKGQTVQIVHTLTGHPTTISRCTQATGLSCRQTNLGEA